MKIICKTVVAALIASIILWIIFIITTATLVSCDKYDPHGSVGTYNELFKKYVEGNIMSGHDWGFSNMRTRIGEQADSYEDARRIIVEDLAASDMDKVIDSDFDYNDLVFDAVVINYNPWWDNGAHNEAVITIQAAMGTLPIYFNGIDQEIHDAFGVPTNKVIDTRYGDLQPKTFTITGPAVRSNDLNDIDVYMVNHDGKMVLFENTEGNAPVKLCVGTDYEWCSEGQSIKGKYPKFVDWARYGMYGSDEWYK